NPHRTRSAPRVGGDLDQTSGYRHHMPTAPDPARVRLAELVAALSLGVDLGFGQPMEHVLRQCMIALRLADRVGLDDDERSVVYSAALHVNVGWQSGRPELAE